MASFLMPMPHPITEPVTIIVDSLAKVFFPGAGVSGLSLTPLAKDVDWYFQSRKPDAVEAGLWWEIYDHPHNELISATRVNYFAAEPSTTLWREVGRRSERWVKRARACLRVVHIHRKLPGESVMQSRSAARLCFSPLRPSVSIGCRSRATNNLCPGELVLGGRARMVLGQSARHSP